jgi:hypothetical protein
MQRKSRTTSSPAFPFDLTSFLHLQLERFLFGEGLLAVILFLLDALRGDSKDLASGTTSDS